MEHGSAIKKKKEHTENMQKPEGVIQKHYVEWKKLNTKRFLQCGSPYDILEQTKRIPQWQKANQRLPG